ncbi:MAG: hypothetical protein KBT12_03695 [Bacteroidales bacterium]|nr:hypothetical protein [Candidatus Physcousia equi]
MKTQKISKLALCICVGIIIVVLGLFFFVGFDSVNDEGGNEPQFTNLLIMTMYAFVVVLAVLTIGNLCLAVTKFRDTGLIHVLAYCGGSIVLYNVLRLICGGQEVPEGAEYTASDMATADAYILTIGILFLVAIVVSFICATGILSKSAIKK